MSTNTRKKKIDYIDRIKKNEKLAPSVAPVINIDGYNAEEWKIYNEKIQEKKKQNKIDLDWADVYSKFKMFESIYDTIKPQTFVSENLKNKQINNMIKKAIPESLISEISRLRKIFEFTVIVIEDENINLENFLEKIRDFNFTLNYFQEISRDDFMTLLATIKNKEG
ncbi:26047_t:CDS:1 [Gigaspora margarita]|uniref:26047_t:CDS:1 n=1 Tax=Gigaspora margarita TaxID=4874 RepID=A0ABN7UIU3_GIGMA|nr:26047_t:CDS:1 [Gigaspora margarita]